MPQNRGQRFKTIHLSKFDEDYRRLKTQEQPVYRRININNEEDRIKRLNKATSKDAPRTNFLTRGSGRLNIMPIKTKANYQSCLQNLKSQARVQLQKLSQAQKLTQIQHILRTTRQLCKKYGYFSLTLAMLKFNFQSQIKIQVWIHPDHRSLKPLHPIRKQTQFQCQLVCVEQLKQLLRMLFPSIDLGDGKTFGTVIGRFDVLKSDMDAFIRRSGGEGKVVTKKQQSKLTVKKGLKHENLVMSAKNIPVLQQYKISKQSLEDEKNRNAFTTKTKNKQTASTLVSSMRSANSLKQKLHPEIKKILEAQKNYQLYSPYHKNPQDYQDAFTQQISCMQPNISQQFQQLFTDNQQNRKKMKLSMTARKFMTMSTQIQSEINNLFDGELKKSNLYNNNWQEVKDSKCFQLARVAEQFQDLL